MPDIPTSNPQPSATNPSSDLLPVRAVTLFSSGVSYTLREGDVDAGEQAVSLTFRTTQINDVLKSLVLLDAGGVVQAATYPSRDPVGRALQSFAVDVTGNPSRADLLRQVRGAQVRAETQNGETLTGRIVAIEDREEAAGDVTVTVPLLVLLSEEGLVSVPLDKVRLLRLLDARLDREFREALITLASGSDDNRRQVQLRFAGAEQRTVRVGYVSEAPVWKVSYRLVLGDEEAEPDAKPYLQGWALVENTSDDDWNAVSLSLVSGRPVSFIQDLYQPLYIERPVVAPDIIASPTPQMHSGTIELYEDAEEEMAMAPGGYGAAMAMPAPAPMMSRARGGMAKRDAASEMRKPVPSQAQGRGAGELFEYEVSAPVSLPRQQAAMIPIVSESFAGEKLSLYNADVNARFPLNAFRLKNETALHLKGGPLTVFDGGVYAGDARMEDVPPGDNRLLTYAVDLAIEGERQQKGRTQGRETFVIRRGVLQISRRLRQEFVYTLTSKAKTARRVLVEHALSSDWELMEPANADERTADRYRFAVSVAPGKTAKLRVALEQPVMQSVALLDATFQMLSAYVSGGTLSDTMHTALQEVAERRQRIDENEEATLNRQKQISTIVNEQERVRENLSAVGSDSNLYRRYMETLEKQENRIEALQTEIERLYEESETLRADLRAYLDTLNVSA